MGYRAQTKLGFLRYFSQCGSQSRSVIIVLSSLKDRWRGNEDCRGYTGDRDAVGHILARCSTLWGTRHNWGKVPTRDVLIKHWYMTDWRRRMSDPGTPIKHWITIVHLTENKCSNHGDYSRTCYGAIGSVVRFVFFGDGKACSDNCCYMGAHCDIDVKMSSEISDSGDWFNTDVLPCPVTAKVCVKLVKKLWKIWTQNRYRAARTVKHLGLA